MAEEAPCTPRREPGTPGGPGTPRALLDRYGDPYITFNPGMLDQKEEFSHGSLIKLCKRITAAGHGNISHEGSRLDLVARLRTWHDKRQDGKKGQKGNNFAFVKVKEDNLPDRFKSPYKPVNGGTPRSILKKVSSYPTMEEGTPRRLRTPKTKSPKSTKSSPGSEDFQDALSSPRGSPEPPSPRSPAPPATPMARFRSGDQTPGGAGATPTTNRKRRLTFSPYNSVQLISPRRREKRSPAGVPSPVQEPENHRESVSSAEPHFVPQSPPPKRRQVEEEPEQPKRVSVFAGVKGLLGLGDSSAAPAPPAENPPSPDGLSDSD